MAPILTRVGQAFGFGASSGGAASTWSATGGVKTVIGDKTYHFFGENTGNEPFDVTGDPIPSVEIVLVGGGGGGSTSAGGGTAGAGGGAGGYVHVTGCTLKVGDHAYTMGERGDAETPGSSGTFELASTAYPGQPEPGRTLTALGGGRGKKYATPPSGPNSPGGSGGGGCFGSNSGGTATQPTHTQGGTWTSMAGITITQVGYQGGDGYSSGSQGAGGGGGAGGVGGTDPGTSGGAGGLAVLLPSTFQQPSVIGTPSDWSDQNDEFYLAGGGGGGTLGDGGDAPLSGVRWGGVGPTNTRADPTTNYGRGGAGNGYGTPSPPAFRGAQKNAQDNTGSGGGGLGGTDGITAGSGGRGVMLIAYPT